MKEVIVRCPARLHFGLFQMSSAYTTMNGGVGCLIKKPTWLLTIKESNCNEVYIAPQFRKSLREHIDSGRILLDKLSSVFSGPKVMIQIIEHIFPHVGLGSKTSFLCSIIAGYMKILEREQDWPDFRYLTGRGGTSGIGLNVVCTGGMVIDVGHYIKSRNRNFAPSSYRQNIDIPKIAGRWELPNWKILLVTPLTCNRVFGNVEKNVFDKFLPLKKEAVERLAGNILFDLIPSIVKKDKKLFLGSISSMQKLGFKKKEWQIQPAIVHELKKEINKFGLKCVALTSMGPTIAVLGEDLHELNSFLDAKYRSSVQMIMTAPQNCGLEVLTS